MSQIENKFNWISDNYPEFRHILNFSFFRDYEEYYKQVLTIYAVLKKED